MGAVSRGGGGGGGVVKLRAMSFCLLSILVTRL